MSFKTKNQHQYVIPPHVPPHDAQKQRQTSLHTDKSRRLRISGLAADIPKEPRLELDLESDFPTGHASGTRQSNSCGYRLGMWAGLPALWPGPTNSRRPGTHWRRMDTRVIRGEQRGHNAGLMRQDQDQGNQRTRGRTWRFRGFSLLGSLYITEIRCDGLAPCRRIGSRDEVWAVNDEDQNKPTPGTWIQILIVQASGFELLERIIGSVYLMYT